MRCATDSPECMLARWNGSPAHPLRSLTCRVSRRRCGRSSACGFAPSTSSTSSPRPDATFGIRRVQLTEPQQVQTSLPVSASPIEAGPRRPCSRPQPIADTQHWQPRMLDLALIELYPQHVPGEPSLGWSTNDSELCKAPPVRRCPYARTVIKRLFLGLNV